MWWERYGKTAFANLPPFMHFPLAEAIALPGVPVDYTYEDVVVAFRREAKKAHPDMGGTAEPVPQVGRGPRPPARRPRDQSARAEDADLRAEGGADRLPDWSPTVIATVAWRFAAVAPKRLSVIRRHADHHLTDDEHAAVTAAVRRTLDEDKFSPTRRA